MTDEAKKDDDGAHDHGGPAGGSEGHGAEDRKINIKIDRETFKVDKQQMTGHELRLLPNPPVGPERDLFEVVPGGSDRKIADTDTVELKNGMRFFTAPAQINPGCED